MESSSNDALETTRGKAMHACASQVRANNVKNSPLFSACKPANTQRDLIFVYPKNFSLYEVGEKAQLKCPEGQYLEGPNLAICEDTGADSGQWSISSQSKCTKGCVMDLRVECGTISYENVKSANSGHIKASVKRV